MIMFPLFVVGLVSLVYLKGVNQRLTIVQLETSLQQLASDSVSRFDNASSNAFVLAASDQVVGFFNTEQKTIDKSGLTEKLELIAKGFPSYSDLAVFGKEGALIKSVSVTLDDLGYYNKFIQHMIDTRLDQHDAIWVSKSDGAIYYLVAHAIKQNNENDLFIKNSVDTVGFIFISVEMNSLSELMIESIEKQGIEYYLTDQYGEILFSPSHRYQPRRTTTLSQQLRQVILSRSSAINQYAAEPDSFYAGYKRLTKNLYLLSLVSEENLYKSSESMKKYLLWFVVFVFFSCWLLLYAQINFLLVNPINMLRKLVLQFTKGEDENNYITTDSDELNLLASELHALRHGLSKSSEAVKNLAYFDELTGLPNRISFNVNLDKALRHCERTNAVMGLLFIDLDNFKAVNDRHGHQLGDELLKEVAVRLENCLRSFDVISRKVEPGSDWNTDLIVRLEGDEFTIILTGIEQAHQASLVAQRIVDVLSRPFELGNSELTVGASIGIAVYPVDGVSADNLIKSADLAMYEAKQKGRNHYQFFTKALNEAVAIRLEIESSLRLAINNNEFFLCYQPKVGLLGGDVVGVEALLRWRHPVKGVLLPANFITVAEDTGLIVDIGRIVLQLVCKQLKRWENEGLGHLKISINLSALQLLHSSIIADFNSALKAYQVITGNLEIEVTENILLTDESNCADFLKQFKALGVAIALDDFGAGSASLTYLRRFPIDLIKIDRSLIIDIEENDKSRVVLLATLELAKALSFKVLAEGVETFGQLQTVSGMPFNFFQGFYFSRPVEAKDLEFSFAMPSIEGHSTRIDDNRN